MTVCELNCRPEKREREQIPSNVINPLRVLHRPFVKVVLYVVDMLFALCLSLDFEISTHNGILPILVRGINKHDKKA